MLFQGRYNITNRWTLNGHYTLQLKNDGNYEGEGANTPGATGRIGDYPEIFNAGAHFPEGRLDDFQRHKTRLWTIYNMGMGGFGDAALSALWRIDSGTTYSYASLNQPHHGDPARKADRRRVSGRAGEPDGVLRGARHRPVQGLPGGRPGGDLQHPGVPNLRPYFNVTIFNAFNNQTLIRWNTTVSQDREHAGRRSRPSRPGSRKGAIHGLANNNNQFPVPSIGGTGGRTWRFAAGFRF